MLEVIEFVEQRLAEEERSAQAAEAGVPYTIDPLRALADVEAKAKLIEALLQAIKSDDVGGMSTLRYLLVQFAQGYIDHPDFRSDWLVADMAQD